MIIKLLNGEQIKLVWSFLTVQLIGEYEGGEKQFAIDIKSKDRKLAATSHLIYAVIGSNIDEPLTMRQVNKLVDQDEIPKIAKFLEFNQNKFKKHKQKKTSSNTMTPKMNTQKQTSQK